MIIKSKYTILILALLASTVFWLVIIKLIEVKPMKPDSLIINRSVHSSTRSDVSQDSINLASSVTLDDEDTSDHIPDNSKTTQKKIISPALKADKTEEVRVTSNSLQTNNQIQQIVDNINNTKKESFSKNIKEQDSVTTLQHEINTLKEKLKIVKNNHEVNSKSLTKKNEKNYIDEFKKFQATPLLNQGVSSKKTDTRLVELKDGESIWMLAERVYGDGKQYLKILKANPELTKKNAKRVRPGTLIHIPQ